MGDASGRPRGLFVAALSTLVLFGGLPGGAQAQAVCSAPHSAPGFTPSGGIRTLEPGNGWVQTTAYRVRSSELFGPSGDRQTFLGDGQANTSSLFITAAAGVAWGVEVWAQLPVHRLVFDDATGRRVRTGLGDPRLSVRVGSELLTYDAWPVALRAGVKLPGSRFPIDARVLPLTEGQTDYELALESGWSFGGVHVLGWAGYRWRTTDASTNRDPGDERFGHVALGGRLGRMNWNLALEALAGSAPAQEGVRIPASRRRMVQLNPSVGWQTGPGRLEVGGQIPLLGRNLPTGVGMNLGYTLNWGAR